jgi:hypothetical protein
MSRLAEPRGEIADRRPAVSRGRSHPTFDDETVAVPSTAEQRFEIAL